MKKAIVVGASSGIGKELALILAKKGMFWVAPPSKAAQQIFATIQRQKSHAYITYRWRLIGWVLKFMPDWLYQKV